MTGQIGLFGYKHVLSLKEKARMTQRQFRAHSYRGPGHTGSGARPPPPRAEGLKLPPQRPGGQSNKPERTVLEPPNQMEFILLISGQAWDPSTLSSFHVPLLEWEHLSYTYPTRVFCHHMICVVSYLEKNFDSE